MAGSTAAALFPPVGDLGGDELDDEDEEGTPEEEFALTPEEQAEIAVRDKLAPEEEEERERLVELQADAWVRGVWHKEEDTVRGQAWCVGELRRLGDLRGWRAADAAGRRRRLSLVESLPCSVAERIGAAAAAAHAAGAGAGAGGAADAKTAEAIGPLLLRRLWRAKEGDVADELAENLSVPLGAPRVEAIAAAAQAVRGCHPVAQRADWRSGVAALLRALCAAGGAGADALVGHDPDPGSFVAAGAPEGPGAEWHDRAAAPNPPLRDAVAAAAAGAAAAAPAVGGVPQQLSAIADLRRWVKTLCLLTALRDAEHRRAGAGDDAALPRDFCGEVLRDAVASDGRLRLIAARSTWHDGGEVADAARRWGVGAAAEELDAHGFAATHSAAATGGAAHVAAAVLVGAPLDARTPQGATPAHYAASAGREDTLACLLAAGAPLDAADSSGRTPLHWAAGEGAVAIGCVRLLRDCGARPMAVDGAGLDCTEVACRRGRFELSGLLTSVMAEEPFSAPLCPTDGDE